MESRYLTITREGPVATLRFDRPPVNAVDLDVIDEFLAAVEGVGSDPAVRAVVLTGTDRRFCAGADVAMMRDLWEKLLTDEDRAVLAAGGFAARQAPGARPALLVVDAQYGFVGLDAPILESVAVYPTGTGERAWRALERIGRLLDAARRGGTPILYSQSGTLAGEEAFDAFAAKVTSVRGPRRPQPHPAYAIVAEVAPRPGDVVVQKRFASAFFGSPLVSFLHRLGVDSLVVCGFTTGGCVRATVVDAVSYGYPVTLVGDACADRLPIAHEATLLDVDTRYGDVVATADAERLLDRRGP